MRHLMLVAALTAAWVAGHAAPAPHVCASAEHRQFDFWIGDWDVTTADGKAAGHNRIESILGGCALQETWSGARGSAGKSLNTYDAPRRRWHQTWVDKDGELLLLEGTFESGRMVLQGQRPEAQGTVLHRIVWAPQADGSVTQVWDSSSDGGKTWQNLFHGIYRRSSKP